MCGRTNKQRDINFLQRLQHSGVTFIAWKWEERRYQTIGLYYSGYNRAGWRVLYVSVWLSAIASLHSPPLWLLQRQVVCDRPLCLLSKTPSPQLQCRLFSLLWPLLIFHTAPPPPSSFFLLVWIKRSIYHSQAKTQSLTGSQAFDQLSVETVAYGAEACMKGCRDYILDPALETSSHKSAQCPEI